MTSATQYGSLREKIAAEKIEREERYAKFAEVTREAHKLGVAAAEDIVPTVMVVRDDSTGQEWQVEGGACGFAWVSVRPGNSSFAIWARKQGWGQSSYMGTYLWVRHFGQSMERKQAYARAYAAHLQLALGIKASAGSRMD